MGPSSLVLSVLEVAHHLCFNELNVEVSGLAVEHSLLDEHSQAMHIIVYQCGLVLFLVLLAFIPLLLQFLN